MIVYLYTVVYIVSDSMIHIFSQSIRNPDWRNEWITRKYEYAVHESVR